MKKLVLILCLVSSSCLAQETTTAQQRVEITLGKLIIENANLSYNVEVLSKQISDLTKQLETNKKEDKK